VKKLLIFEFFKNYKIIKLLLSLFKEIKEVLAITFDIPLVVATAQGTLEGCMGLVLWHFD